MRALVSAGRQEGNAGAGLPPTTQPRGGVRHPHRAAVEQHFAPPRRLLRDEIDYATESLAAIKRRRGAFDDLHALEIDRRDVERSERAGAPTIERQAICQ